jgi:ribosomal protein L14E/L6E/L27E
MCLESDTIALGQAVHSKAGRDKGIYFIIVGIIGDEYVLICDGDIRKIEKPKKKKLKHLVVHDIIADDIKGKLEAGVRINDADIRKSLGSLGLINQSNCEEV